jgi:decaprenyl-phosphate phosphoribosyltransferase
MAASAPVAALPAPSASATLRLLRPRQWIKNLLVLAPLLFAGLARVPAAAALAIGAALLFTAASALVYVFNDIRDVERDRSHPAKRRSRPLAAGEVTVGQAWRLGSMVAAAVGAGLLLRPELAPAVIAFVALNVAYSLRLKELPVVDVLAVSAGYVLRVHAGAVAVGVPLSAWMAVTTFALSIFLVAGKRAVELATSGGTGRGVLHGYTPRLLRGVAWTAASAALTAYGLYTVFVRPSLLITVPLVLFAVARYALLMREHGYGESPEDALWEDGPLLAAAIGWVVLCIVLIG